jgi:hypothetical protein
MESKRSSTHMNLSHAPSRVAQSLARHTTSAMTDRYTHVRLNDERAALAMLPDPTAKPSEVKAKVTGTDDALATDHELFPTRPVRTAESEARFEALPGTSPRN